MSSATAAAAALQCELTLPEVSQTVIITRQAGRTPVPKEESLRSLGAHQATMMIFLSVSMIETVVQELRAAGYADDTPVAVVEKASWPDERKLRATLVTIAAKVAEAGIRKTAMIVVGDVLRGIGSAESKLYDKDFAHGCRS